MFSEILEPGRVNNEEKKAEYYRIIHHESLRLNKMIDARGLWSLPWRKSR
jgi:hypothetical protein